MLIAALFIIITGHLLAQQGPVKAGWQHKDLQQDSVYGISTQKAYQFVKGRKSKQVIVAVIDGGIDTSHADLKAVFKINSKEKRANSRDEDRNRYVDDYYGWSFIGSAKGNVEFDTREITRLVKEGRKKFANRSPASDTAGYSLYLALNGAYELELQKATVAFKSANGLKLIVDTILMRLGKNNPTLAEWNAYQPQSVNEASIKALVRTRMKDTKLDFVSFKENEIDKPVKQYRNQLDYGVNLDFDPRNLVGDNYEDLTERYYGSPDVTGPNALHGTHVAGIIAAVRNNGIGIDGIADNVRILPIRAVPDGDERDKDIANAIRYAVDNGASIINMSFGKPYSNHKGVVDEAVKYAMKKDVLIVHAAGNDGLNLDLEPNFPNRRYEDRTGQAEAWLEVGASVPVVGRGALAAGFSNYGKNTVDVFAPGVGIYSTIPGSRYEMLDGTSMAAPVVSGVAALLRSYFPTLKAWEVKEIIMQTAIRNTARALIIKEARQEHFNNMSISGGVINAYEAVKMAAAVVDGQQKLVLNTPSLPVNKDTARSTLQEKSPVPTPMPAPADVGAPGLSPTVAGTVKPQLSAETSVLSPPSTGVSMEEFLKSVEYNEMAPQFALFDLDSNMVKLEDYKGKIVVVDFWATWCIPCIRSFPAMKTVQEKYKDDPKVKFLFIHTMNRIDSATAMVRHFMEKNQYPFHVLMDPADPLTRQSPVFKSFHLMGLPTKVVIDPKGVIRYKTSGWQTDSNKRDTVADELSAMIEALRKKTAE